jgi:uncharacterized protein YprB with RNaseH-like and TPR domain
LRDRLRRIQLIKQDGAGGPDSGGKSPNGRAGASPGSGQLPLFEGWVPAGYLTLRREIGSRDSLELPEAMPEAAGIVMPGLSPNANYGELLFFDLETTGLSGGAGTLAFLAAFGRLEKTGRAGQKTARHKLRITQYLLLDYPGESDFVAALLGEFSRGAGPGGVTMVSYNGRCFDSQILKTRCLMNGVAPPEYRHADLLYPARRLWKRLLPNCSQGTIETGVLGIDRTGDIPGAMAPDIWFSFLRNGDAEPLLGICDHNRRDIEGLATIFSVMARIADDPLAAVEKVSVDLEMLSLRWYFAARNGEWGKSNEQRAMSKEQRAMSSEKWGVGNGEWGRGQREKRGRQIETGKRLIAIAAERGCHRAALQHALILLETGRHAEGREWLFATASSACPPPLQVAALRALAIDSEHRLGDAAEALAFTEQALELLAQDSSHREGFERRRQRLKLKLQPRRG